jgi:site-specific DNA-cytosine methylase
MDNKTNCLTTVGKDNVVVFEKAARKPLQGVKYRYLTRNELERLQTLPDNYTLPVSYSKANHMIGNGWTVDVIAHLFTPLSNQI